MGTHHDTQKNDLIEKIEVSIREASIHDIVREAFKDPSYGQVDQSQEKTKNGP